MGNTVARSRSALLICSVVALGLFATATITFAASKRIQGAHPHAKPLGRTQREPLVVPDVSRKPYVFAKGILEDAGFAWHVSTKNGFAANVVLSQSPTAGTRVIDSGAPEVVLSLKRSDGYGEKGTAENDSPFEGTPLQLIGAAAARAPAAADDDAALPAHAGRAAARKGAAHTPAAVRKP